MYNIQFYKYMHGSFAIQFFLKDIGKLVSVGEVDMLYF